MLTHETKKSGQNLLSWLEIEFFLIESIICMIERRSLHKKASYENLQLNVDVLHAVIK